jgi:uncharacterized repeat protein (TIGR01451 family)
VSKLDLDPGAAPEVGSHRAFELLIELPEGNALDVALRDDLVQGATSYVFERSPEFPVVVEFVGIASVNGQPPTESSFTAVPADGTRDLAVWAIGRVVTESEDDVAGSAVSPSIRIQYSARIENDLATQAGGTLQNVVALDSRNGATGELETVADTTGVVTVVEAALDVTKAVRNVTPGKDAADPPAFGDVLEYVVTAVNTGDAVAYDTNFVDTLPVELSLEEGSVPTASIDGVPVPGFVATPLGAPDGPLVWGRENENGSLDLPANSFLELTYRAVVRTPTPDTVELANSVWTDWTSRPGVDGFERTGTGCPTITPPNDYCVGPAVASRPSAPVAPPSSLQKDNTQASAAVGEAFRYQITVPSTPYAFPLYDVRIDDDLSASAADLRLLEIARVGESGAWTPTNTGTAETVVIEGSGAGIDIPAGEQVTLELTVVLEDTPTNVSGLTFTNTASYVYNWLDGNAASQRPGLPGTTASMTIVGPDTVTLEKTGPATLTAGTPGLFRLDVQNTGTGGAWGVRVTDRLPNEATGGTCDTEPDVVAAQLFEADGVTPVSEPLVAGADFSVSFGAEPTCEMTLALLSAAGAIEAGQRWIIEYEASLDLDSQDEATLTNVAGAVAWFGTAGEDPATLSDRRAYVYALTDGTVGVLDEEDAHTVNVALPRYQFEKTVSNVTTGDAPAVGASPGDTLRYQLVVENLSDVPLANFRLVDELDRLNTTAAFAPGTLQLVTAPAGADATGTVATGGASGSGLLSVAGLSLPNLGDRAVVEFEVELAAVLANGSVVLNQAQLEIGGVTFADSDDPNVNGASDPAVAGDEDPTAVLIESAPVFRVEKVSRFLEGDPEVLLAGEALRYTITVENIGDDDASDARLRDPIPVNTRYVPGSTTLGGVPIPDGPGGSSPLGDGIALQTPQDPTSGTLPARSTSPGSNVAVVTFDVVVDAGLADGIVISNQAFVSALVGGVSDAPSDDPRTPLANDPTRDVVGNAPLLFAEKSVSIGVDGGTPGIVDPGDVLRYRIAVSNTGAVAATLARLRDDVPGNTTWVADSLRLNGEAIGQPDGGVSPLAAGIGIQSPDVAGTAPAPEGGSLTPGETALVTFDLRVDAGVSEGTLIKNQALLVTEGQPNLLTDGDGNPSTGPEPTVVVVGAAQQLSISNEVSVVGGGPALPGAELEYQVRVVNIGATPALSVVLRDDLEPGGPLRYVAGSARLDGVATGTRLDGSTLIADFSAESGPLQPGGVAVLRFRAEVDGGLALGTRISNKAEVSWNDPTERTSATVTLDVGGTPGVGLLSGALWHDEDFDKQQGAGELALEDWTVELYRNGQLAQSVQSDAAGLWSVGGLSPNETNGDQYRLTFRAPGAGANTAALGRAHSTFTRADSTFTDGLQEIDAIIVPSGSNLQDLNLPIDPNGVIYDALVRAPVVGATVQMRNAGSGATLPEACFDDPAQQGQVTNTAGFYKFDLNFADASCPSGGRYRIVVANPGEGFVAGDSEIIPPQADEGALGFSVPACPAGPDDAVPATATRCEIQSSAAIPPISVPARAAGTQYYVSLVLDSSDQPGSSQLFNNHVPVDPALEGIVAITKSTPSVNVSRGQLVPYEITLRNELGVPLPDLTLVDRYPAGFRYVDGSARVDGVAVEPTIEGGELIWTDLGIEASSDRSLLMLLAVGAGVGEGKFVNRVQAISSVTGVPLSGEASATVRVVPDPTFACTDVMGKVFDDANGDGDQGPGEEGLSGVRLVTARGLAAMTDAHGRFHITCAVVPNESRGSNFILKLDDRTLPTGYRLTSPQVQVKRATAGKALRFRYGASVGRVVGLDLADAVFEPGSTEMRAQWKPRLELLMTELFEGPATLRLSYLGDVETAALVEQRLASVEATLTQAWDARGGDRVLPIETEVYWRRGAPGGSSVVEQTADALVSALSAPFTGWGSRVEDVSRVESVERNLSLDTGATEWVTDPSRLAELAGDRLEEREVRTERVEIVKLTDVVPPIRFDSGAAEIPASTVDRLRTVLREMKDLPNVRLQVVGHADDQALTGSLLSRFGDNEGLSRERAGEVAEFLQRALALPPEAISFEWMGEGRPVASNQTERGRAMNRRVEVEVWYDEIEEQMALQEVVVPQEIKRVKVCRTETVCKLNYREGHARRARVRNLVAPLSYREGLVEVTPDFVRQVSQALENLQDEQNVTVKFIGYTDDVPLAGRAARIYGTHLSLSKARSRRVALSMQDALGVPSASIESDGRGAAYPVASNDTERGRALNRRIEVEFWYDDPLQKLSDDLQACPDPGAGEVVTRVYDPPWGRIEPLAIERGDVVIPDGVGERLHRAMADIAERENVRLRFVGYTANERLDRRTAAVYGDDIGLSADRARRAMERVQAELALQDAQVEHEGRGYVHSHDVVNAGFLSGKTAQVRVEVVYDELAVVDDHEGIDVIPVTRELELVEPLALNLMHITVDGEPLDDPARSSADVQRCTDVALDRADIRFRFDDLASNPRLSVAADRAAVLDGAAPVVESGETAAGSSVRFHSYTNYGHYIDRAEVRIFERGASLRSEPLSVVPIEPGGVADWKPEPMSFDAPMLALQFVLRAYDADGQFDETAPQSLWVVHGDGSGDLAGFPDAQTSVKPGLLGYGEGGPVSRNIPLGSAGSVKVQGSGIPAGHTVWLGGTPVPVDGAGRFVAEAVVPTGLHTVEVAVLDPEGNGELFLRDLELAKSDWFYVGIADLTFSAGSTNGDRKALEGKGSRFDPDSNADGRLAFFLRGKFGEDWQLTASADTREGPIDELFSNFMEKSPEALFRRIDPDIHYPTFGDDGTVEQMAPTSGKFFVELTQNQNRALWGNFKVGYLDNELAQVDRGLYGANVHYETVGTTSFGDERVAFDAFAAEPGTVPSREEFRGTGGSLYFLRVQDVLQGSERVRIEVRDKASGLVTGVTHLRPTVDYDIDYLQGRVLLSDPLDATTADGLLVRNGGLGGNEVWLVVQYEYTPGFQDLDALSAGGQAHWWVSDFLRIGAMANRNDDTGADSSLYGADVTARWSTGSWLKLQGGRSEGLVSTTDRSNDGGFNFFDAAAFAADKREAYAYRADLSVDFADVLAGVPGSVSLYYQQLEAGYSAPGMNALTDTHTYGGRLDVPLGERFGLSAKTDRRVEEVGLDTTESEVDVAYRLSQHWRVAAGVRYEKRTDNAPIVPVTQEEGTRTDGLLQIDYDSQARWRAYGFGQATLQRSGDVEENRRVGVGGAYRLNDRLSVDAEVSFGDLGPAVQLGTTFQETEQTQRYFSYGFSDERGLDGAHQRRGNLVSGMRSRLSDSASVYIEDTYQHSGQSNGLARAMGMTIAPTERWTFGANWEFGTLIDQRTDAETNRNSGGAQVAYQIERFQLTSGIEYRSDETENPLDGSWEDRTTWFFRNRFKFQMTPDWRLIGKFDYSFSDSSMGDFFDGGYTEAVVGYAYRPIAHDRLDVLAKYTFFDNVPTVDQVSSNGLASTFIQRSHIAAIDATYELTPRWSLGGKYAYRLGEVSLDRTDPKFFDNSAHLFIVRTDWRFMKNWETVVEGRVLEMPDLDERRSGALVSLYRQLGENLKVGVGYNFTDFSEDLTDLSYDHQGFFFNLVGAL